MNVWLAGRINSKKKITIFVFDDGWETKKFGDGQLGM